MQCDSRPELYSPMKYVRLAAILRRQIIDGTLAVGEPVPSITQLAISYGWTRQTCGHALRLLEKEGLLTRHTGLSYYVTEGNAGNPADLTCAVRGRHGVLNHARADDRGIFEQ